MRKPKRFHAHPQRVWVFRKDSDPQDRARWLHDVRTTLERDGIGWNMWDFGGRDDGQRFGS
jgi:hypothetical protein